MFATVNTKKGGLKGERVRSQPIRPQIKFPRGILDQVISKSTCDGESERAPGPGLKHQAASVKLSNQPVQASSDKRQAPGSKRQASGRKRQAP